MTVTKSESETRELAAEIGKTLKERKILYLTGDLGSGKTTFTKGLAEYLGISHFTIKSPTYTYIRKHKTDSGEDFYHIDLYRIEAIDELLLHEIEELMENEKTLIVVEWADRLTERPKEGIEINLKYIDKNTRELQINE